MVIYSNIINKIWKKKDTGKYNFQMFNTLGWAFRLQENKSYNGIDDLMQDFFMKVAKVTVKNETSEFKGKTYDNLNVKRWEQSAFPQSQHQFKQKDSASNANSFGGGSIDISSDDLPF